MIYPKFINEKSTIGVPAPSSGAGEKLYTNKFKNAEKRLNDLGYNLVLSNNLYKCKNMRSADKKNRASEINNMFENDSIDLILCASGGEFLVEILPYVNFDLLLKKPKFVCGFSDPTGLLYTITTKYDIATIYGQNFGSYGASEIYDSEEDFLKLLNGEKLEFVSYKLYEDEPLKKVTGLEPSNLTKKVFWKTLDGNNVNVKGRIIGGCFDIISELAGTKYDGIAKFNRKYKKDGVIWYFDNCEISMEEVVRVLWKMNELDYFKYAKAVIFGRFGVETSYLYKSVKECLEDSILTELKIPIVYDADISHKDPCIPVINGSIASLNVENGKAKIRYELK